MIDESNDVFVDPSEVAEAMFHCIANERPSGGFIVEVLKNKTRNVEWRMDPGPEGPGATVANRSDNDEEALGWLAAEGWGVAK